MVEVINNQFFILDLQKRVERCINGCVRCLLSERKRGKAEGWLNPIPKGDIPLDTWSVDPFFRSNFVKYLASANLSI